MFLEITPVYGRPCRLVSDKSSLLIFSKMAASGGQIHVPSFGSLQSIDSKWIAKVYLNLALPFVGSKGKIIK